MYLFHEKVKHRITNDPETWRLGVYPKELKTNIHINERFVPTETNACTCMGTLSK